MKPNHERLIHTYLTLVLAGFLFQGNVRAQGVWVQDSLGSSRSRAGATAIAVNAGIYEIGFDSLQIFDPINHTWNTPPDANTYIPSYGYQAGSNGFIQGTACEVGNKIYVFGGYSYNSSASLVPNSLHILDIATMTWSEPQTFGHFTPREDLMSCVVNGKIYAIGGNNGYLNAFPQYLNTVEIFDPASNTWSMPVMNGSFIPGIGQTVSVVNGKIYIVGGIAYDTNSLPAPPCQVFDPSTRTWDIFSSSGFIERWYATSSVVGGKIYVIGGATPASIVEFQDALQVYDPTTDTWSTLTPTGTFRPVSMAAATVVNGKIYVLGGNNGDITNEVQVFTLGSSGVLEPTSFDSTSLFPNPNPTSGLVTIRDAPGKVTVSNVLGLVVFTASTQPQESLTLNLTNEPAGIYFVRTGEKSSKVIVSH